MFILNKSDTTAGGQLHRYKLINAFARISVSLHSEHKPDPSSGNSISVHPVGNRTHRSSILYGNTVEENQRKEADFRKIVDHIEAKGDLVNLSDFKTTKDLDADAKAEADAKNKPAAARKTKAAASKKTAAASKGDSETPPEDTDTEGA